DELPFDLQDAMVQEFSSAVFAQIVRKVGRMSYWADWAHDVGKIAQTQITRIRTALETDEHSQAVFHDFLAELQDDLNPSVTQEQAIELLAQHIITRPVFNALFEGHEFIKQNSVSIAMEKVLNDLDKRSLDKETESLQNFYDEVKWRIKGTKTAGAKQQLVKELYDKFFRKAFRRTTDMLGIAFTPVEIVDYMIHSIENLLNKHFQTSMSNKDVHIIDPFVGTGTFITRLLQSGIIRPEDLRRKYEKEIHANEIVLLAYYVAGINIEAVYHDIRGAENGTYEPYERIVFQDTFQSAEQENQLKGIFPFNYERIEFQQNLPLTVVLGNPPYSRGQKSAGDNAQNVRYPTLDARIASTYVEASNATLTNSLYDSYVRAFRWASDRLGERGIVGFVTGAGWLDGNAASGIRACFEKEFSHIYTVNLRGNTKTQGERGRKESQNVFGAASRSAITITFLVKNDTGLETTKIHYHDIGDYLKRNQKLDKLKEFRSVVNTPLKQIKPNHVHDWIDHRNQTFFKFIPLIPTKSGDSPSVFRNGSLGLSTNRDAWIYNFSKTQLRKNIEISSDFFNSELARYKGFQNTPSVKEFVQQDRTKIAWNSELLQRLVLGKELRVNPNLLRVVEYRPFTKVWCYFDPNLITRIGKMPQFFDVQDRDNRMICSTRAHSPSFWQVIRPADLHLLSEGTNCYPLSTFNAVGDESHQIFKNNPKARTENTGGGLALLRSFYPTINIGYEQCFYYVYGILHSIEFIERFNSNLQKDLPRIPAVATVEEFLEFAECGRLLADLHVEYEQAEEYPVVENWIDNDFLNSIDDIDRYRIKKMRFPQRNDTSTIRYNEWLTISGIPDVAYDFKVSGKSCVGWIMDRQRVSTHKASGIVNDANDFAIETMNDPAYPLKLLKKAITVGIKTLEIQKSMPPLKIHKKMSAEIELA
ncbi:MAG: DEAD/DEAH box helicase, partial [Gammaproteobacteria bacterium]|nr:DEAD/DEAH box helicase [Gammaproteobacteria bacterium]